MPTYICTYTIIHSIITLLKILTDLFNKIYKTGYIPNDLAQSIFITNLNNLRYADDTALLAESESALQDIVDVVRQNSEEKGLSMNVKNDKDDGGMS